MSIPPAHPASANGAEGLPASTGAVVRVLNLRVGRPALVGTLAIAACIVLEIAIALVAAAGPSKLVPPSRARFPDYISGPFGGLLRGTTGHGIPLLRTFVLLLLVMVAAYAVAVAFANSLSDRVAIGGACVACAIMLLAPPLILTDVFNYVNFARLGVVHHLNPYQFAPAVTPGDPAFPLATWHNQPTPYGPLFTLATYPTALLGVGGALWALKIATAGAAVGCVALVAACARRLGQSPGRAAIVLGLNPVLLVFALGGVHNDYFMMLAVLAGLLALLNGRELTAGATMVAAVAVKLVMAPVVPFLMLAAARRRRVVLGAGVAALFAFGATAAIFGLNLPGLSQQSSSITRHSPVEAIALAFGRGRYTPCPGVGVCANHGVQVVSTIATVAGLALVVWYAWRSRDWISSAGWAAAVLVLTLTVLMPWYLLWLLPFAILSRSRSLHAVTAVIGGYLLVTTQPVSTVLTDTWDHGLRPLLSG